MQLVHQGSLYYEAPAQNYRLHYNARFADYQGKPHDFNVKAKTTSRAYRVAVFELRGIRCRRGRIHTGTVILWPIGSACMGPAALGVRAGMDRTVRLDGHRRLVGLAQRRLAQPSPGVVTIPGAARAQCPVVVMDA